MSMLRIMKLEAMSGVGATMVAHILLKTENPSSANISNREKLQNDVLNNVCIQIRRRQTRVKARNPSKDLE